MWAIFKFRNRDSTPIGPADFFRQTIKITYWVLPINLGLLGLLKWIGIDLNNWICHVIWMGFFLNNFLALLLYAPLWDRRLADFYAAKKITLNWYRRAFWGFVIFSPIIGLYFHILFLSVTAQEIRWGLRRHFLAALICSMLIQGLSSLSFRPMLTANFNVSFNYVMKAALDAATIAKLKNQYGASADDFHQAYQREHRKDKFSETGQILADAAVSAIVFNTLMAIKKSKNKDEDNINAYLSLADYVTSIQQLGFSNVVRLSYPYGLYLLVGNIELPLLMACEVMIFTKKKNILNRVFSEKHARAVELFHKKYKKSLSDKKYKHYREKFRMVGGKIEAMKLGFSYF
ncbi:MAG: hypothetical protein A2X86_08025 [Bdellovibrionales bacterium GWA2_49_15]|nr:MAG: hypothetical protein A2X86_08025 [Bdellovibrionales bacterium GWA2_49_15]HAZ11774.1 hypothetical protein [Bdellovibrionales bacterium]